jgi:hypothetical protein
MLLCYAAGLKPLPNKLFNLRLNNAIRSLHTKLYGYAGQSYAAPQV